MPSTAPMSKPRSRSSCCAIRSADKSCAVTRHIPASVKTTATMTDRQLPMAGATHISQQVAAYTRQRAAVVSTDIRRPAAKTSANGVEAGEPLAFSVRLTLWIRLLPKWPTSATPASKPVPQPLSVVLRLRLTTSAVSAVSSPAGSQGACAAVACRWPRVTVTFSRLHVGIVTVKAVLALADLTTCFPRAVRTQQKCGIAARFIEVPCSGKASSDERLRGYRLSGVHNCQTNDEQG